VKWFYLWGLGRADLVLARSDMQQEALRVVHGIVAPVLANGFPLPARRPGVPREHVLWVGRAQELKRPHLFLDLAERFPDERFVMVMSVGDPGLAGEIRRRALAITNLTLKDGVQLAAIGAYFERAKALVNTSSIEGFPNTFVQAAMAGTPILSLDVDPDGFLGKEGLGRCASGDFGRLAADLGEVLSEPATWSTLSDAAWRHANANHDIGQVADVLAREIASIAGRDSLVDDGMVRSSDNRAH
jgi:glycosyltransferase involved in cell wall biosynthesis